MHENTKRSAAFIVTGLLIMGFLMLGPQVSGGRAADITITILEDDYPNTDNQNYVPVAVDNSHRFNINLENVGTEDENYTLQATFINPPEGWTDDPFITLSDDQVTLNQGDDTDVWVEIAVPPVGKLGDQAEVSFVVTGVDSTMEFSTTISVAVRNWTAYIDGLATFEQGDSNEYDLTIVNLNDTAPFEASKFPIDILYPGSLPDWKVSFDPGDGSDPSSWPQSATHSSDIPAGATITVPFRLTLNDNVKASDDTTFLLQANNNDAEHNTNYYMVEGHAAVLPYYAIYVSVDGSSIAEVDNTGGIATFDLTVENYGNDDDSFTIAMTEDLPNANWDASIDKTSTAVLEWKGGTTNSETFTVTLEAPASQLAESEGTATVTITSVEDDTVTTSRTLTLRVTQVFAISLTDPAEKTQYIMPGATGEFSLTINNGGNGPDTVALAITGDPQWIGDPAFTYASAGVTEIEVDAASSEVVLVNVMVPAGVSHNDEQSITIKAMSEDGVTEVTTIFKVKADQTFGLLVENAGNATTIQKEVAQGASTFFSFFVNNTGNGDDSFDLVVDGCGALTCKFMVGADEFNSITVGEANSRTVALNVEVPEAATVGNVVLTITVTSQNDGTITDDIVFTAKVIEKAGPGEDPGTDDIGDDDDDPGFEAVFAVMGLLAALGVMRRRQA